MGVLGIMWTLFGLLLRSRASLIAENLALRQQLAVLQRQSKRPRLRLWDRVFWVWFKRIWPNWRSVLVIVQPDTVVRWHKAGFRLYWRWRSQSKPGRPKIEREVRDLIQRMARENPTWGAPRIQSELALLGHCHSQTTIDKYIVRHRKPPSQTWRTFLDNHVPDIVAIDFFTVPTATFRILFAFVVLRHDRRMIAHVNVTEYPTAAWAAQQIAEAFPDDTAPRFLIRDRDSIFGSEFKQRVAHMGIKEVLIAPRAPWQNPYAERVIGSIRRECLNHVIVLNERHLKRILRSYVDYYNNARTHLSLERNAPIRREVEPPHRGPVVAIPRVGGLHHRYCRAA